MRPRHRDLFPPLVDGGVAAFWIRMSVLSFFSFFSLERRATGAQLNECDDRDHLLGGPPIWDMVEGKKL
jgi:hypothetical protein